MAQISLTRNERWLCDYLCERPEQDLTIERIAEAFYEGREVPKNWRGSIAAQMRTLSVKLYALGIGDLERVSRLGTKSPAVYRFTALDELEEQEQ
jgi:hypothetical protein